MDELAVEDAGALGVGGQEPDDKGNLQLKIKREPGDRNADRIGSEQGERDNETLLQREGKNTRRTSPETRWAVD